MSIFRQTRIEYLEGKVAEIQRLLKISEDHVETLLQSGELTEAIYWNAKEDQRIKSLSIQKYKRTLNGWLRDPTREH